MITLLNWCLAHWYVWFWLAVLGVFDGVRDFFYGVAVAIGGSAERKHQRALELERARAKTAKAQAKAGTEIMPTPGPCVHRRVLPVHDGTGERVAWLCQNDDCREQLPRNWAVEPADLPDPRSGHE